MDISLSPPSFLPCLEVLRVWVGQRRERKKRGREIGRAKDRERIWGERERERERGLLVVSIDFRGRDRNVRLD